MPLNRKLQSHLSALEAQLAQLEGGVGRRIDPVEWAEKSLGLKLDPWQRQILVNDSSRLLLNCPRQSGKSTVCAALAGFEMVSQPGALVVAVAPTQRQSALLLSKIADAVRDEGIASESSTRLVLTNGSSVDAIPGDKPTGVRGLTATTLLVDEASRVRSELLTACLPMTAATGGRQILLTTPAGASGGFFDFWQDEEEWDRVTIAVKDVAHYSEKTLKSMKRKLGDRMWQQEFEGRFLEPLGALFASSEIDQLFADRTSWSGPAIEGKANYKPLF